MAESTRIFPARGQADDDGPSPSKALGLLSDDTRLGILKALWEMTDPFDPEPISFSALLEHVGTDDSGKFNYHLNKLTDHFVRRTDEGYTLQEAGNRIVRVLISGTAIDRPRMDPAGIDVSCLFCGDSTEIYYENGLRHHRCTGCNARCVAAYPPSLLSIDEFPPAGLLNRTPAEIYDADQIWLKHRRNSVIDGVCPECSGPMPVERIRICDDHEHDPFKKEVCGTCGSMFWGMVYHVCEVCKHTWKDPTTYYPVAHPAVIAFLYEHGIEFDNTSHEQRSILVDLEDNQEVVSDDPLRIQISICLDADELRITFDEQMSVVDVDRRFPGDRDP